MKKLCAIPAILLFLLSVFKVLAAAPEKSVLILHSYTSDFKWTKTIDNGLHKSLGNSLLINTEYLDALNSDSPQCRDLLKNLLHQKYCNNIPDLIIVSDNFALNFMKHEGSSIFPNVPVVFCGINEYAPESGEHTGNITGVAEYHSFEDTIRLARKFHKTISKFLFFCDPSRTSEYNKKSFLKSCEKTAFDIPVKIVQIKYAEEIIQELKKTEPDAVVFVTGKYLAENNSPLSISRISEIFVKNCSCPIYTFVDSRITPGIIGGKVVSGFYQGITAADMAKKILAGIPPDKIPVVYKNVNQYMFDYSALIKHGISISQLPEGSIILNKPDNLLDQYPYLRPFLVFLFLGMIIAILFLSYINILKTRAKEDLEAINKELDSYFSNSLDLLCIADTEGYFRRLNPQWEKILGYALSELEGTRYTEYIHPDDIEATIEATAQLHGQHEVKNFVNRFRTKDGSYRWIEWRSFPAGKTIYAAAHDITEKKEMEQSLRKSEKKFRSLFESMSEMVVFHEMIYKNDIPSDYRIIDCNPAFTEITGISRDSAIGMLASDLYKTGSPPYIKEYSEVVKTTKPYCFETFFTPMSKYFHISVVSLQPDIFATVTTDITSGRQTEQALDESQEKYRIIVENIRDVVWQINPEYRCIYISPADETMRGYRAEEVIGKSIFEFMPEKTADEVKKKVWQRKALIEQGGKIGNLSLTIEQICKNGSTIWTEVISTPYYDKNGKLLFFQGITRDISDRIAAERERREIEQKLQHTQKLESLGILAGGIAHDFNNLLMSIIGNLDLSKLYLPQSSPALSNIDCALQASTRAADLIKQMLAYSGKGKFIIQSINLNTIIEENAHLLKISIGKDITLNLQLPEIPLVSADPTQMQQIIMNLITNASEAIGDNPGVISLRTGVCPLDSDELSHSLCNEKPEKGDFVFIEVEDTGCGMDSQTAQKLFDPFFTTKFTGRGLGMSAVLGIVRGHHGTIFLKTTPGTGTCIKICFPVSGEISQIHPVQISEHSLLPQNLSVLVVDDEPAVLNVCCEILKHFKYTVYSAKSGTVAETILRKNPDISLCLIDYSMPGLNGVETAHLLHSVNSDIKILISSGYSELEACKINDPLIQGFLQKPYKVAEIQHSISKTFNSHIQDKNISSDKNTVQQ